ncbi:MAG TPA: hypothetical protein VG722_09360 [Tepidisphaeraceae bacterium]|nr:hypothetical protein [Tepidisphaeraceae bacterium]
MNRPMLNRKAWRIGLGAFLCIALAGCTENKKPTTRPANWADQAQADPMNFDPKMDNSDISGGSIGHFDKNAFDRDVDDVLNP